MLISRYIHNYTLQYLNVSLIITVCVDVNACRTFLESVTLGAYMYVCRVLRWFVCMYEYLFACVRSAGGHGLTKAAYQSCILGHHDTTVFILFFVASRE